MWFGLRIAVLAVTLATIGTPRVGDTLMFSMTLDPRALQGLSVTREDTALTVVTYRASRGAAGETVLSLPCALGRYVIRTDQLVSAPVVVDGTEACATPLHPTFFADRWTALRMKPSSICWFHSAHSRIDRHSERFQSTKRGF